MPECPMELNSWMPGFRCLNVPRHGIPECPLESIGKMPLMNAMPWCPWKEIFWYPYRVKCLSVFWEWYVLMLPSSKFTPKQTSPLHEHSEVVLVDLKLLHVEIVDVLANNCLNVLFNQPKVVDILLGSWGRQHIDYDVNNLDIVEKSMIIYLLQSVRTFLLQIHVHNHLVRGKIMWAIGFFIRCITEND